MKVTVQTKWRGVWGEKVRISESEYQCSAEGEMDVSEEHARVLCASEGWRRKPTATPAVQKQTTTIQPKTQPKNKKTPLKAEEAEAPSVSD